MVTEMSVPMTVTATVDSTTVSATVRNDNDDRQNPTTRVGHVRQAGARHDQGPPDRAGPPWSGPATVDTSATRPGYEPAPARYPTPRTVVTMRGASGSCSTFARSRCTWTFTSRVSAL